MTYQEDFVIRDVTTSITRSTDNEQWEVTIRAFCEGPLHSERIIEGKVTAILFVEHNDSIVSAFDKVSLNSSQIQREVTATIVLYVPKVLRSIL